MPEELKPEPYARCARVCVVVARWLAHAAINQRPPWSYSPISDVSDLRSNCRSNCRSNQPLRPVSSGMKLQVIDRVSNTVIKEFNTWAAGYQFRDAAQQRALEAGKTLLQVRLALEPQDAHAGRPCR